MIETLKLQNFKVLRDVEVKLRPFTVIVGPNGSGKSTLLEALHLLAGGFGSDRQGIEELRSRVSAGDMDLFFSGSMSGHAFQSGFRVGRGGLVSSYPDAVPAFISSTPVFRFSVEKLAQPSYPKEVDIYLPSDGEGLSAVLASLYLEDVSKLTSVVEQLKVVIPTVEAVHIRRASIRKDLVGYELIFDMKGAPGVRASSISDGTLLTLGLLTAVETHQSDLILIDDLERGLHPRAQADLVLQLRQIQKHRSDLQIIATSHSPYLIDSFAAEEVLLTSLGKDGYAAVRPLTDHPEFTRWKDLMDAGEFWSTVGESWITEGTGEPVSQ